MKNIKKDARGSHEIWAQYSSKTVTIYQAYSSQIADAALKAQRLVAPFSYLRMTWIKPSYLWLMARSQWAQKRGQERILAMEILRSKWEYALGEGVLTHPEPRIHGSGTTWQQLFEKSLVHVQWDPERNLRGTKLTHRSIQVGLSRELVEEFATEWIVSISDLTEKTRKIRRFLRAGETSRAKRLLPLERLYPVPQQTAVYLGMTV